MAVRYGKEGGGGALQKSVGHGSVASSGGSAGGGAGVGSGGHSAPHSSLNPIHLAEGSVLESAVDLSLPGLEDKWELSRTYNSDGLDANHENHYAYITGNRWQTGILDSYADNSNSLWDSAHSRRTFTSGSHPTRTKNFYPTGLPKQYDTPFRPTYHNNSMTTGEFVYQFGHREMVYDGEALINEGGFDVLNPSFMTLKEIRDRNGNVLQTYSFSGSVSAGRIDQVTLSQGWTVEYTYYTSPTALAGKLRKAEVKNGSGTVIAKAEYTFVAPGETNTDLGIVGDLIQVKSYHVDTSGTLNLENTIQYRYYRNSDDDGMDMQLKMVFEADSIERIIEASGSISDSDDILDEEDDFVVTGSTALSEFASRAFTYYTANADTSDIDTPWTADEDLETTYGGTDMDEYRIGFDIRGVQMVKTETVGMGCGSCGGGDGLTRSYFYMDIPQGTIDADEVQRLVIEDTEDGDGNPVYRTVYGFNYDGYLLRKVKIDDPTSSPNYWCESWIIGTGAQDLNQTLEQRSVSAHTIVDTAAELRKFLDPAASTNDADTLNDSSGLITVNTYSNGVYLSSTKVKEGESGTAYYVAATDWGDGSDDEPEHLPVAIYSYRTQTTTKSAGDKTEFAYTFWDGDDLVMKTKTTTLPAVPTSENGSNVSTVVRSYWDSKGRLRWTKDGEGNVSYFAHHPDTGNIAYVMVDVETDDLPAAITAGSADKWIEWDDGASGDTIPSGFENTDNDNLQLVSTTEYDDLGRAIKSTDSGGMVTHVVYRDNQTLTFAAWNSGTNKPLLPIQVVVTDDGGDVVETYSVDPDRTAQTGGVPTGLSGGTTQAHYQTWTRINHNSFGQTESVDAYHDIPSSGTGTLSTNFNRTFFRYDAQGRKTHTIQVVSGTSTSSSVEQVSKATYDFMGRTIKTEVGVSSAAHDMTSDYDTDPTLATLSETFFDESTPGSGSSGIGDSLVISTRSYYTSGGSYTTIKRYYNWRNQQRGVEGPGSPYSIRDLDFQGRVVAIAKYSTAPSWSTAMGDPDYADTISTNRLALATTEYDTLGRAFRSAVHAVDDADGSDDGEVITNTYYNRNNQIVATQSSGQAAAEIAFDGAGRPYQQRAVTQLETTKYSSGAFVYRDPAPDPTLSSMTSGDDNIIQLTHSVLDEIGQSKQTITLEANHNDGTAGLDLSNDDDYVQHALYMWYDDAHRLTDAANYGTSDPGDLWEYNALTERPSTPPSRSDSILVTTNAYNSDSGRLESVTDPKALVTKTIYDDLGRTLYAIENYVNFNESTEANTGPGNDDQVTKMSYNGINQIVASDALDADANGNLSDNQTTTYLYEDAYHASLVTNEIYPDSSDTTSSGTDQIKYTYNLDKSPATRTDQRTTVITYAYDAQRRPIAQTVTSFGGATDNTIKAITKAYDNLARVNKITSHGNATADPTNTADVANQIILGYTDLGAIATEYQEHDGVKDGSTLDVSYAYDTTLASTEYSRGYRPKSITYPDGRIVHITYGSASSIPDLMSRVDAINDDSAGSPGNVFASYDYNGAGRLVSIDYEQPDVIHTYASVTPSLYDGLDRFGRTRDHGWYDYDSSEYVTRYRHGYDRNSNRLYREDLMTSALDELYTYDELNRLTNMQRGDLNGTWDAISTLAMEQDWSLDALGNWSGYNYDSNGDATDDLVQTRTHNDANEISAISETTGSSWIDPVSDNAGNMTEAPIPGDETTKQKYIYDAWNRLVEVQNASSNTLWTYEYDGRGRRIVKNDIDADPDVAWDSYYTQEWQLLEVRKNADTDPYQQFVWGVNYIDSLIVQFLDSDTDGTLDATTYALQDSNFNITALVDISGDEQERYLYTPYGQSIVLDDDFSSDADGNSDYSNPILFAGYVHDSESNLYHVRNRHYHPAFGRWMQRDPLEYVDGSSLHQYVSSSPIDLLDPSGAVECSAWSPSGKPWWKKTGEYFGRETSPSVPGDMIGPYLDLLQEILDIIGKSPKGISWHPIRTLTDSDKFDIFRNARRNQYYICQCDWEKRQKYSRTCYDDDKCKYEHWNESEWRTDGHDQTYGVLVLYPGLREAFCACPMPGKEKEWDYPHTRPETEGPVMKPYEF